MVQILKDDVRNKIAAAAETLFARVGYEGAAMGAIAREAGVATGTIYKYFADKEALFKAVVDDEFRAEFLRLTRSRIAAFEAPEGLRQGAPPLENESGELLRFWIRNRLKTIIILARAQGSVHEGFAQDYIRGMQRQAMEQIRRSMPDVEITDLFRFMMRRILDESVRGIVSTLEHYEDEGAVREALAAATTYRVAGVQAFTRWYLDHAAKDDSSATPARDEA